MYTLGWNTSRYNGDDVIAFLNAMAEAGTRMKWWPRWEAKPIVLNLAESKAIEQKVKYRRTRDKGHVLSLTDPGLCKDTNMTVLTDLLEETCPAEIRKGLIDTMGSCCPFARANLWQVYGGPNTSWHEVIQAGNDAMSAELEGLTIRTNRPSAADKAKKKQQEVEHAETVRRAYEISVIKDEFHAVRTELMWWAERADKACQEIERYQKLVPSPEQALKRRGPYPPEPGRDYSHIQGMLLELPGESVPDLIQLMHQTSDLALKIANSMVRE